MVSKVEEAMKRNKQLQPQAQNQQQQLQKQIQCNKGKAGKFKRSSSNLEEDDCKEVRGACASSSPPLHFILQIKKKKKKSHEAVEYLAGVYWIGYVF
ncbi:hypothetical protein E2542_SST19718 [Spatholobus suberectus]|nr:hypothetical protein E2542_SST19718 [Spatholobus suberectus]